MRVALVLVALLLSAGCISRAEEPGLVIEPAKDAAPPTADASAPATNAPTTGKLTVLVRMPDKTPLPNARVNVGDELQITGADGLARFTNVAPGTVEVTARKEAHRTAQLAADVAAGEETIVEAVLPAETGDQHAHENGVFDHRDVYRFSGRFDCSATYVIITGDCLILVENATNQTGAPLPLANATSERNIIPFPLDLNWTALVVEMSWTAAVPTDATGGGMTLALEPAEAPTDGHAAKYARAAGASPLRVELRPGVKHETATLNDMPDPQGGEVLRARAYVMGAGHNAAGLGYLGVGAAAQHEFDLFVTIFYGEPPAEGYSAIQQEAGL